MQKSLRSQAEEHFAATQKKAAQAGKEKEKARKAEADHVAKLRALRLAKEAADKEAAAAAVPPVKAKKPASKKKEPVRKPKPY